MKLNQYGLANSMTVGLIVTIAILIVSLIFGIWSFSGRQKYKNNADQLISSAVSSAKQQQQTADGQAYAIAAQKPLLQYLGPSAYGTINLYYPRTWSSYVNSSDSGGFPIDGFFYPGTIPSVTDTGVVNFALRLQVENEPYTTVLQYFDAEQQSGQATVVAYSLPKLPGVVGIEAVGVLSNGVKGTVVILPLRTEALEVWTEGTAYLSEFNSDILPNLSFSP